MAHLSSVHADTAQEVRNIPCLDPNILKDMHGLMDQRFPGILRLYLDDTRRRLESIAHVIAMRGHGRLIAREALSIRSSSHYFGALRLAGLAETLEILATDDWDNYAHDSISIAPLFEDVRAAFEETLPLFHKYLEEGFATNP